MFNFINFIVGDFETILLDNSQVADKISLDDAIDYDDEVDSNGDFDIGEISSQYLALELY